MTSFQNLGPEPLQGHHWERALGTSRKRTLMNPVSSLFLLLFSVILYNVEQSLFLSFEPEPLNPTMVKDQREEICIPCS